MASSALDPRLQYGNHQSNAFDAPSAFMHAPQPSQRQPLPPAQSIGVPPNTSGQQPYSQDDEHRPFLDSADHNVEDHTDDEQHESPETQADDEGHQHTRYRHPASCLGTEVAAMTRKTLKPHRVLQPSRFRAWFCAFWAVIIVKILFTLEKASIPESFICAATDDFQILA